MKNLLYTCFALFCAGATANAQENAAVQNWQLSHPQVHFISSAVWSDMSAENRALLVENAIIFENEMTSQLIQSYEKRTGMLKSDVSAQPQAKDADYIKRWLGMHTDLKIIKHSEFIQFSTEQQQAYLQEHALILQGESVTLHDINNYE